MANFTVGIDHLLEGTDSDTEHENDKPKSIHPPKNQQKPKPKPVEKKEESKPELSGMQLLKAMYQEQEQEIKRRKSAPPIDSSHHKKIKVKLKIGSAVDIYSASKGIWTAGTVKEFKGDTLCIVYNNGKKMKWLKKNSPHFRIKKQMIDSALHPMDINDKQRSFDDDKLSPQQQKPNDEPPPAFSIISLDAPPIPNNDISYNKPSPSISSHPPQNIKPPPPSTPAPKTPISPSPIPSPLPSPMPSGINDNVYVYDVTFTTQSLGLSLCAIKDGQNCIVRQCLSSFAQKKVDPGSMICAVNGKSVINLPYDKIVAFIKQNSMNPPLRITFRGKVDGKNYKQINNVNERGLLQIKVVACMQLKHAAKYCSISVGNAHLKTKELSKSNHHPEWNEVLSFNNFRCDHGKMAIVKVYNTATISHDKLIGQCSYPLPIKFSTLQKDTLELRDDKNKICGCIILNTIVVRKK